MLNITNYTFLFIGLIYATFLPGFVITELFLPKLAFWKKLPLYQILSVIISCFFSYFTAIIFGFTRETLFGCFLFFLALLIYVLIKKKPNVIAGIKKNLPIILIGILIYLVFFIALFPAIFGIFNGNFVMGGPNWQDTAMHLSIIQSLTQGNFLPQSPYFSGQPLNYYYFSDLHAAIVNTFFGKFFPQVLVILNPFLATTFFFSVFALSYEITKKRLFSVISGLLAVFYGNFGFINAIKELITKNFNYINVITSNPFNFDKHYLQMAPMADYFLQNRPMMVGLPSFVLVILLLLKTKETGRGSLSKLFTAGIITAALIKFQLFGFVVSWIFFGIRFLLELFSKEIKFPRFLKYLFVFGMPSILAGLILLSFKVEGRTIINIFTDSFSWGPWQKHDPIWYFYFLVTNLGLGFVIYLFIPLFKRSRENISILPIYITSLIITIIPLIMKFTIYEFDMLKFFYYLIPIVSVVLAFFYSKYKRMKVSVFIFVVITVISSLTSVNMLVHSYLNKNIGYSYQDYESGIWIIENTPQKSVFVTMPTVHSAPTDIGGRLRVISYINWPYSHGLNTGEDNVFVRVKDVEAVYESGDTSSVKVKYGADYVFYGQEEGNKFPLAAKLFDLNKSLKLVYNRGGIKIYEIIQYN
jgi:hypothetical protein